MGRTVLDDNANSHRTRVVLNHLESVQMGYY